MPPAAMVSCSLPPGPCGTGRGVCSCGVDASRLRVVALGAHGLGHRAARVSAGSSTGRIDMPSHAWRKVQAVYSARSPSPMCSTSTITVAIVSAAGGHADRHPGRGCTCQPARPGGHRAGPRRGVEAVTARPPSRGAAVRPIELTKTFPLGAGQRLTAVDRVSLSVEPGLMSEDWAASCCAGSGRTHMPKGSQEHFAVNVSITC